MSKLSATRYTLVVIDDRGRHTIASPLRSFEELMQSLATFYSDGVVVMHAGYTLSETGDGWMTVETFALDESQLKEARALAAKGK